MVQKEHRMDQRSSSRSVKEQGAHQSAQSGSQFKCTVLETLGKFGRMTGLPHADS